MGSVRLYAIGIDEVRDIFRATEENATVLRAIAAQRFGDPAPSASGLLGKLGPVFRRAPDAPVVQPGVPSGSDVDALLCGRYVPPHRLSACWVLLEAWLERLAWSYTAQDVSEARLNDFDFGLVRAEVPARLGLRGLLKSDLGIALMPFPGLAAGWGRTEHVKAVAAAWRLALDRLNEEDRSLASGILAWLDNYPGWIDAAPAARRPAPDLVAILRA